MNNQFAPSLALRPSPQPTRPVLHVRSTVDADESAGDMTLVDGVRRGDEDALRRVYERYGGLVYSVALRLVGEAGLAQEVTQDVFVRCWERARAFDPSRGSLQAWLIGIARNRGIDVLRSRHSRGQDRERELPSFDFAGEPVSARDGLANDVALRLSLRAALDHLSAVQREAIELAIYGELTQAEIAGLLDVPLGTVKTRIRDGMARLRADIVTGQRAQGSHHD
jgi:RNA polymerase sigma-70 factor (ECF subfamily)